MAKRKTIKGKLSRETKAAALALELRNSFKTGHAWPVRRLEQIAGIIVRDSTAAEATLAFVAIPPQRKYAQARMKLLARILLLPQWELCTPWYEQKLKPVRLLPAEERALEAYVETHPGLLAEHLGAKRPLSGKVLH